MEMGAGPLGAVKPQTSRLTSPGLDFLLCETGNLRKALPSRW